MTIRIRELTINAEIIGKADDNNIPTTQERHEQRRDYSKHFIENDLKARRER